MEEQFLFTQIHEALDIPTPPGAYERLRVELTKRPVRARRWPVFQIRTSDMRFRLAAGLAIVAIAVAAAAAVVAIHNASNNVSPAGSRMSIQAYQKMVDDNFKAAVATNSAPCQLGDRTGCGIDASRGIPVVEKWIADISRPDVPERFVVVNAEMRQVLLQNLAAQRDLLAASNNHDGPGIERASWIAAYAGDWLYTVLPSIAGSHQVDQATYVRLVASERIALNACGAGCGFDGSASSCMAAGAPISCQTVFDSGIGPKFDSYSGALIQDAAPPSLASKDEQLQVDLERAHVVLLSIRVAIGDQSQTAFNSGLVQLVQIKGQIDQDAAKITG